MGQGLTPQQIKQRLLESAASDGYAFLQLMNRVLSCEAMMSSAIQEQRGWVLLLIDSERHYLIGNAPVCGLNFIPAIAETDYETHNVGRVSNCWLCEKALEKHDSEILR